MIVYTPLYETMRKRGISTYQLITYHGVSRGLINRLKTQSGNYDRHT